MEVKVEASLEPYLALFMASWNLDTAGGVKDDAHDLDPQAVAPPADPADPPAPGAVPTVPIPASTSPSLTPACEKIDAALEQASKELAEQEEEVAQATERFHRLQAFMDQRFRPDERLVSLNIRGQLRVASARVLCHFPRSVFSRLFASESWSVQPSDLDGNGSYVLDVDVGHFDKVRWAGQESDIFQKPLSCPSKLTPACMIPWSYLCLLQVLHFLRLCKLYGVERPLVRAAAADEQEELEALLAYLFPDDLERVRQAFGCPAFADSAILTSYPDRQSVMGFLPPSACGSSTLLYRGSRDGWEAQKFSEKCDSITPTLVILQTEEGFIFGGFTTHRWTDPRRSATELTEADETFIFSLMNPAGHAPFKMPFTPTLLCAVDLPSCFPIYGVELEYGPAFGLNGPDDAALDVGSIVGDGVTLRSVKSRLMPKRFGFQAPSDIPEDQLEFFLAGKHAVQLVELEVFALKGTEHR